MHGSGKVAIPHSVIGGSLFQNTPSAEALQEGGHNSSNQPFVFKHLSPALLDLCAKALPSLWPSRASLMLFCAYQVQA